GKVKSFSQQRDPAEVVVSSDRGEVVAELGPTAFLTQEHLVFDTNADVNLRGYETTRDGRRVFVVTEVTGKDGRGVRLRGRDGAARITTTERQSYGYVGTDPNAGGSSAVYDLSGTVSYVDPSGACGESAQGRLVTIRTSNGDRVVALGPGGYLTKQGW